MKHPAKLAFFGTDEFSDATLRALLSHGFQISYVITKPDAPVGRKRVLTPPAVKITAESHNIPVMQPTRALDLVDELQGQCEAAIVVSYGKILPQAVLDLFPKGLINVHASLLPKYRGASPIEAALLHGDATTGVSLMALDAGMDTGSVYTQAEYAIQDFDDQSTLYPTLATLGAELLIDHLPAILDGTLKAVPQDDSAATHVGMIRKADGIIDWSRPATDIAHQIRAYCVWPGTKTILDHTEVTITSATVVDGSGTPGTPFRTDSGDLAVYTGSGALQINTLTPAGKRQMTGREFLAGHRI